MRWAAVVVVLVGLLLAVAPAHAGSVPIEGSLKAGPQLSGGEATWIDGSGSTWRIRRAPPDGSATTLFTVPRTGCLDVDALAASATRVVVLAFDQTSTCVLTGARVLSHGPDGQVRTLESVTGDFVPCNPVDADVAGDVAVVARSGCPQPVGVYDLAAGTPATDLGLPSGTPQTTPGVVRIAGRYVAVAIESAFPFGTDKHRTVVVWDREKAAEAYRVDVSALLNGTSVSGLALAVEPDGQIVAGGMVIPPTFGGEVKLGWASAAEPTLHMIPGTYGRSVQTTGRWFDVAGDLVAVPRRNPFELAVVGLDGSTANVFAKPATAYEGLDIAFDGGRIAWRDAMTIRNEAYPYTPPAPTPTPTPSPAPTAAATPQPLRRAPAVRARAIPASVRARRLTRFTGTATDPDGDLASVRIALVRVGRGVKALLAQNQPKGCAALASSGRLRTFKATKGRCIPKTFLRATGTASWSYKLKRRLPAGSYVLYVQAIDRSGLAGGGLRRFRVR